MASSTYTIAISGKKYHFEHDYTGGPWFVNPRTNEVRNQPLGERHPFWVPYYCWLIQGRKVVDGLCQWKLLPPRKVRAVNTGGRNWMQLSDSDPPHPEEQLLEFAHTCESLWEIYIAQKRRDLKTA